MQYLHANSLKAICTLASFFQSLILADNSNSCERLTDGVDPFPSLLLFGM